MFGGKTQPRSPLLRGGGVGGGSERLGGVERCREVVEKLSNIILSLPPLTPPPGRRGLRGCVPWKFGIAKGGFLLGFGL